MTTLNTISHNISIEDLITYLKQEFIGIESNILCNEIRFNDLLHILFLFYKTGGYVPSLPGESFHRPITDFFLINNHELLITPFYTNYLHRRIETFLNLRKDGKRKCKNTSQK